MRDFLFWSGLNPRVQGIVWGKDVQIGIAFIIGAIGQPNAEGQQK